MKFELKGYQDEAANKVLTGLRRGSREYDENHDYTGVSLSAPTGAGKTVIAANVIERLLFGDPEGENPGDPDAVIVWLTDDPALNAQTRKKLLEASDRIQPSHLVTLDDGFDEATFPRGKVFFLNIQKLGKNSNLASKKEGRRKFPLWVTITNTIKTNGAHYYLFIDEAHRGTGKASGEDRTIAQKLINGEDGKVAPAPVVLGISATPERFEKAIKSGPHDRLIRTVTVPVQAVRESGLIKDVLSISYRGENQTMETTLVRQAVANLKLMDAAWNTYTDKEEEPPVRPVLVVQIPPSISDGDVGSLLDVCLEEWPALGGHNVFAHALESHVAMSFGKHTVNYIAPQNIQDHPNVRVVLFKEALTTGWDCPRAEVMVSLRTAKDTTYIAQLIGRMVRSPLARRIETDETLNRVRLYLPNFDKTAVTKVKENLESDEGGLPTDIEVNSVDAPRNPKVPAAAFGVVEGLTSYAVPGPVHRSQVTRLHKFAALLVGDKILADAIKVADTFLVGVMETERLRLNADGSLAPLIADAETATMEVMNVHGDGSTVTEVEEIPTDAADLERLFTVARRRFPDGLASTYWGSRITNDSDDPYDAKVLTVALGNEASVVEKVETEAADRVRQWFETHGDAISMLSEDRKAKYAEVRSMARDPEPVNPGLPTGPISMTGDETISTYDGHLYSDKAGKYRAKFGGWEEHVIKVETARDGFTAWYRNPTGGQRALRIPFELATGYGKLYPDFVFIHTDDEGTLRPCIADPHGHHLSDAGAKLRGLGAYAEKHGAEYARVIGIIKMTNADEFRFLDLKDGTVRAALSGVSTKEEIENVFTKHGSVYA